MTDSQSAQLLGGVLLGLSIAAPIGPVNVAMIHRGLKEGFTGAFLLGAGSTTADLIYILLAYAGADPLSHLRWARLLLFSGGAVVMGWLGLSAIRAVRAAPPDVAAGEPEAGGTRRRSAYVSGFGITIVNPMTIAFWLGILSASLAARGKGTLGFEMLFIGALLLGCMIWVTGLASALHFGRQVAGGRALRVISTLAGVMLFGFALQFAWKAIREIT